MTILYTKDRQKQDYYLLVASVLFCYYNVIKEVIILSILDYVNSKEEMRLMPFMTVYRTILMLIEDGYIKKDVFETSVKANV